MPEQVETPDERIHIYCKGINCILSIKASNLVLLLEARLLSGEIRHEIVDNVIAYDKERDKDRVYKALVELWKSLELGSATNIRLDGEDIREMRYHWNHIAEISLGDDAPSLDIEC